MYYADFACIMVTKCPYKDSKITNIEKSLNKLFLYETIKLQNGSCEG